MHLFSLGIEKHHSALDWIVENSPCYRNNSTNASIFACIHSHVGGNKCFLSSVDLHNQFVYEKLFPHMLAIVVEIGQYEVKNVEYYQLSSLGSERTTQCNNIKNTPLILHESCANDERFFTRQTNTIQSFQGDDCCIIDARDFNVSMQVLKSNFGEYNILNT